MRPIAAALAGSGAALGAGLVIWPLYVLVANLAVARGISLPGAATEVLWGSVLGGIAAVAATGIAGPMSRRAWQFSAFGAWLVWAFVLALLLCLHAIPLVFVATAMLIALATTAVIAARVRPRVAPDLVRALLAGSGGFAVFVVAHVLAIAAAARFRPSGVGFAEWRCYIDGVDILGLIAVALGAGAALVLSLVISERRSVGVLVSLLAFGLLFIAAAPFFGFLSACYAGEVLRIFSWLVSPRC